LASHVPTFGLHPFPLSLARPRRRASITIANSVLDVLSVFPIACASAAGVASPTMASRAPLRRKSANVRFSVAVHGSWVTTTGNFTILQQADTRKGYQTLS
jgi:hypothetical protein